MKQSNSGVFLDLCSSVQGCLKDSVMDECSHLAKCLQSSGKMAEVRIKVSSARHDGTDVHGTVNANQDEVIQINEDQGQCSREET
ncbi:hypothetical protein V1264_021421 [Littorina saxatilis]|uniref:Uncharacterized protein n=1 Tax=Littorina saxatilis TaxID=31220 RepID=A0AAN9AI35_9CAEN